MLDVLEYLLTAVVATFHVETVTIGSRFDIESMGTESYIKPVASSWVVVQGSPRGFTSWYKGRGGFPIWHASLMAR